MGDISEDDGPANKGGAVEMSDHGVVPVKGTHTGNSTAKSSSGSQAVFYGIAASLRHRKKVKKFVENLLDGMFS